MQKINIDLKIMRGQESVEITSVVTSMKNITSNN